jgi:hypothetical protein
MILALRKLAFLFVAVFFATLLASGSSTSVVAQRTQPALRPVLPPRPRLALTSEQEYVIRGILLKDFHLPKQKSASETIGDPVPQGVTLYSFPPEIVQKVPKVQSHEFFVTDRDTVILVSPSDRRIAEVIKKKSTD